ncbi:hypothetical protein EYF80_065408 [Liparis tanakae]|uniref:Uncharacterized protein n=1 Tax=Liparis tanakae TaxID=230148 RepID=A0A4Z2E6B6_9TELE|nr:hypothetical protein EYF80_065408 [Liparis tanakae]
MFSGISLNRVNLSSPLHPSETPFKDQSILHLSSPPHRRRVDQIARAVKASTRRSERPLVRRCASRLRRLRDSEPVSSFLRG